MPRHTPNYIKKMEAYANRAGNSGVAAFSVGADFIDVRFVNSDDIYRYTNESAGAVAVARMKVLAVAGRGLSAFISREVKDRYAFKT